MDKKSFIYIILFVLLFLSVIYLYVSKSSNKAKISSAPNTILSKNNLISYKDIAKRITDGYINFVDVIKSYQATSTCNLSPKCLVTNNQSDTWYGSLNTENPLVLNGPVVVKISLKNEGGEAGINLIGRLPNTNKEYWEGITSIYITSNNENLEVNVRNGLEEEPTELLNESVALDDNGSHTLYLIFDEFGKQVVLLNHNETLLKNFNIVKETKNTLNDGLFPDKKAHIGFVIAPNSKLYVTEFVSTSL